MTDGASYVWRVRLVSDEEAFMSEQDEDGGPSLGLGVTEDEVAKRATETAPTFSDTEPGAGHNFGAAGDPTAPSLGGEDDVTTLSPNATDPISRRQAPGDQRAGERADRFQGAERGDDDDGF